MTRVRDLTLAQRFQLFSKSATDCAIVLLDLNGQIIDWSAGAQQLFGWTPEEAAEQPISIIAAQEDIQAGVAAEELARVRQQGQIAEIRCYTAKDGSRFLVDGLTFAIPGEDGACLGFGKILRKAHPAFGHPAPGSSSPAEQAFPAAMIDSAEEAINEAAVSKTQLQKREQRRKLLDTLTQVTRAAVDPVQILESTTQLLGRFMGVTRCVYAVVESDNNKLIVRHEWAEEGVASSIGVYSLDIFGPGSASDLRQGRSLLSGNIDKELTCLTGTDLFTVSGTKAVIACPLVKAGQLVAILAVHQDIPRRWTADEVNLLEEVIERSGSSIEYLRMAEALQASKAHLSSLFEQTLAGVAEYDLTGQFLRVNHRLCEILGRDSSQIIGRHYSDFAHPDDRDRCKQLAEILIETGHLVECETRYMRPDGSAVWASTTTNLIHTPSDTRAKGALGIILDITQRKHAEEALRTADRRKDEFLAMLAHELRNPLSPIDAAADLLRLAPIDPAQVQKASEIISRQVKRMTDVVNDLLDVSRVTQGLVTLQKTEVDAKRLVSAAVEQVRPLMATRGHHLAVNLPPEPAFILGDPTRLVQVITNLLTNAAKYTPDGGNIVLALRVDGDQLKLSVSDKGIGMDPELLNQAFTLFAQPKRVSDRSQGGMGIGLALVKSLVELHEGQVSAFSEGRGKGSHFTVTLPKINDHCADHPVHAEEPAPNAPTSRLKVMIVDDNIDGAQTLAMLCEALGHQVEVEHTSLRALQLTKSFSPDLCLLDIGLPDMDGYELAARLRAQPETAHTTLAAVTGYGQADDRNNVLATGFDYHFIKPINMNRLMDLLKIVSQ